MIARTKPLSRFPKRKPDLTIGNLGIVRLKGQALADLRRQRFVLDGWRCIDCGTGVSWASGHLAHVKSRGAGGSDTIENTRTKCAECHMKEHNCGGKPLPKKG